MKIYECSPFFNENLLCSIKLQEGRHWVNELHITESNKTFTYNDKDFCFAHADNPMVKYHQLDGTVAFKRPKWGISRHPWYIKKKLSPWDNEAIQRNDACSHLDVEDDDIVILSDIDEIIDHAFADKIIEHVKKHRIITVKLQFTCYFFNLFLANRGNPPDFSYRVFIMTGKYFRCMQQTSDQLRKCGERSQLLSEVYCMEGIAGFHHSWIGGVDQIAKKLVSYCHSPEDHNKLAFVNGAVNRQFIEACLNEHKSIYGSGPRLFKDSSVKLLDAVQSLRTQHSELFVA